MERRETAKKKTAGYGQGNSFDLSVLGGGRRVCVCGLGDRGWRVMDRERRIHPLISHFN